MVAYTCCNAMAPGQVGAEVGLRAVILVQVPSQTGSLPDAAIGPAGTGRALDDVQVRVTTLLANGIKFRKQGKTKQALEAFQQASRLLGDGAPSPRRYDIYYQLAAAYAGSGSYHQALTYHYKSQEMAEAIGSEPRLAQTLVSISDDLYHLQDYGQSNNYLDKALRIFELSNQNPQAAECVARMADNYRAQGESLKAINAYRRALGVFEQVGDLPWQVRLNGRISAVLTELKSYPDAIAQLQRTLVLADSAKLPGEQAGAYLQLASCYRGLREDKKAAFYGSVAVAKARRRGLPEVEYEAHRVLSATYGSLGKYEDALRHFRLYASIKDRLQNQEKARQIAEMQIKYDSEKRGKEIAVLTREKKIQDLDISRKETLIYTGGAVVVLLLIIALVLHRRNLFEQEVNHDLQLKNQEINYQKAEIETQRDVLGTQSRELNDAVQRIRSSIAYAKRIQDAMLPTTRQLRRHFSDPLVYFRPKDMVSGDFYWFAELGGKVIVVAADCTGHGVPGAFMSMIGHQVLLKTVGMMSEPDPAQILGRMHTEIVAILQQHDGANRDGIDMGVCIYDPAGHEVCFAGAKHSLLIFSPEEEAVILAGDRKSIGGMQASPTYGGVFSNHSHRLAPKSSLYMFTDGYSDQFDEDYLKKFTLHRFRDLLKDIHNLPSTDQITRLDEALANWRGRNEQTDDILILGLPVA